MIGWIGLGRWIFGLDLMRRNECLDCVDYYGWIG